MFLNAVFDERRANKGRGTLHIINIRDWHEPGAAYDQERRVYGSHCESGTWGAEYIDGLERFLDPADPSSDGSGEPRSYVEGELRVCHVHADSVFDFRPRADAHRATGSRSASSRRPSSRTSSTSSSRVESDDVACRGRDPGPRR